MSRLVVGFNSWHNNLNQTACEIGRQTDTQTDRYSLGYVEADEKVGNVLLGRLPGQSARPYNSLVGLVGATDHAV